jgi:transcriptional regulator with XRE-family HTH domain
MARMDLFPLAQKIRTLRAARHLTLEQVAARSGITKSVLSKVENFRVTPSLPTIAKLAEVLGVTIAELFEGLQAQASLSILRRKDRLEVKRDRPGSKIVYYSLAQRNVNKTMEPFLLVVPPGEARKKALTHESEEFLMVLRGSVRLEHEQKTYRLNVGDCAYFDGRVPHTLINLRKTPANVLAVYAELGWNGTAANEAALQKMRGRSRAAGIKKS